MWNLKGCLQTDKNNLEKKVGSLICINFNKPTTKKPQIKKRRVTNGRKAKRRGLDKLIIN